MSAVVHWKLSPNEEAERIRKEKEHRRKTRLLQVRQQQRVFAKKLRDDIKQKKEEERQLLLRHLNAQHEAFCEEELDRLQEKCQKQLQMIGSGHVQATNQTTNEEALSRMKKITTNKQKLETEQRYKEAIEELSTSQILEAQCRNKSLVDRKKALDVEKERARRIADMPSPQSYDIVMDLHPQKGKRVTLQGVEGYASSYYHIPSSSDIVQRASLDQEQLNACQSAVQETFRRNTLQQVNTRQESEQNEKARLRHRHALARVKLEKDQEMLVKELEQLMRQDRAQRRQQLSTMPPNLFQPMQRRNEIIDEQQRDMEQAFEDLFVRCQGSGKGLDDLGKKAPLSGTLSAAPPPPPAAEDDSVHYSSDCPELSVEEMTTITSDTLSSTCHQPSSTDGGSSSHQTRSLEITTASDSINMTGASNSSSGSMKKLMEMVEKQRQAWEEQQREQWHGGQDDTVGPSHHHSSKDTTASSCDPASLSVATASSSWDTSNNSASRTDGSSTQQSSIIRQPAPVHIPTVDNSIMSSDASHRAASQSPHYGSPAHLVSMSSPTHSVSSTSKSSTGGSQCGGSQCSTPTNKHTQQTNISSDDETTVMPHAEEPFSWENLSEVEDKESPAPAMTEPEEIQMSPQQFSALLSEVSTEQSPSLQEAFRQHKADFISNSQLRQRQMKEKSKQRMMATTDHQPQRYKTPSNGVNRNFTKPKCPSRVVQFSSPLTLQETSIFTPPTIHRANTERFAQLLSSHDKITAKQMKERTKRLYSALPEVRQKKEAELRQQMSATNRERARQFHQKLQLHRKKQMK